MSTMVSFTDNNLSTNFLSESELRCKCPAAFKTAPTNPGVSEKYVQANTATVISDLAKLGWYPVDAKQCRAKKNSAGIRSFHMVAFQNPNVKIVKPGNDGGEIVDAYPRIILTNSHDGFNSFSFRIGLIRLCCSNGLCIGDTMLSEISIRHINYTFERLRNIVNDVIENVPVVVNTMNKMQKVTLQDEEKRNIAKEMVKIRKGMDESQEINISEDTITDILTPLRKEDDGNNLWTVFNVCQEKMIKGLFSIPGKNNKYRKQRRISSIKKDLEYNVKLWDIAAKYIPVPVAA